MSLRLGRRHVSVWVDNQTGIPLQVDAEDAGGGTPASATAALERAGLLG
jgi:hypothetical protein